MRRHSKGLLDFAAMVPDGQNPRGVTQLTPQGMGRVPNGDFPDGVFQEDVRFGQTVSGERWNGPSLYDNPREGGLPFNNPLGPTNPIPGVEMQRKPHK